MSFCFVIVFCYGAELIHVNGGRAGTRRRRATSLMKHLEVSIMLKFLASTVGIIFLIGLLVVIGILALIF